MQKIEFLVWNGKQYVLNSHHWLLERIDINLATVQVFLKPKPAPPEEEKPEPKKP